MKLSREVACEFLRSGGASCTVFGHPSQHNAQCDRLRLTIEAARKEGAEWMREQIMKHLEAVVSPEPAWTAAISALPTAPK